MRCALKHGFEELKLDLIWCSHFSFNENSKRVIEKSGFNYRFTENKTFPLLDDKEVENIYYNITKEEYFLG